MYCHPAYLVRNPPAISPTVAPAAPSAPQIPSALLRSAPSANMFITIDRAAGSMIAAPNPCTARLPIRNASPVASAQASEAAVNTESPSIRIRRRPSRSAARPPSSKNPPNASAYAVTTHCKLVSEKCRSRPIVGNDTLTIVRSMIVMKYATANSANARQRLILLVVDIIGPPVIWQGASFGRESGEPRAATATARSYLSRRQTVPGLETHRPDRDLPGRPA